MPCSGLKSATSCTPGALCSTSIVCAPCAARPVWLVTRPTRLPFKRREAVAREHVDPGKHRRRLAVDGCDGVPLSQVPACASAVACHAVQRRRGSDRVAAAATVATRAAQRRDVALAVRMHAAREEDHIAAETRIDPQRVPVKPV